MFQIYWRDRLFEWIMAMTMILMAIEMAIWHNTMQASSFRYMLQLISSENMAVFFTVFGMLRIAALIANGRWPKYGPIVRAMGAGAAALMWSQMGVALVMVAPLKGGIPSPGIPVYIAIVIGELISAYRVLADARPADR